MELLYFYDQEYTLRGVVDEATVIYTRRWYSYNDFEIHLPENFSFIQRGYRVIWGKDTRKNGVIRYIQITDEEVIIKGFSLLWLLGQRITVPLTGEGAYEYTAPVEDIMTALVQCNAVDCENTDRNFPRMITAESQGRGEVTYYHSRYNNLLEDLISLSRLSGLGIGVYVDLEEKTEVFTVYEGVDRSRDQTDRSPVVFRRSYDNITDESYFYNDSNYRNCAYAAGQGEGVDRVIRIVGDRLSGENRREIFVDARDIEDPDALPDRGEEYLADYQVSSCFEASILSDDYQIRWDLGDIVTVLGESAGVLISDHITELVETWDVTGESLTATFGWPEDTLSTRRRSHSTGVYYDDDFLSSVSGSTLIVRSTCIIADETLTIRGSDCGVTGDTIILGGR